MDEWRVRDDVVFCIRGCVGLGGWGMWEGRWEVGGGGLGEGRGCGDVMKLDLKM